MMVIVEALRYSGIQVRARVDFDDIEARNELKVHGYKWTPGDKVWTRMYDMDPDFHDYAVKAKVLEEDLLWMIRAGANVTTVQPKVEEALDVLRKEMECQEKSLTTS